MNKTIAWIGFLIWTAGAASIYYKYAYTAIALNIVAAGFALWSIALTRGWVKWRN
jgi:hypothetical protein